MVYTLLISSFITFFVTFFRKDLIKVSSGWEEKFDFRLGSFKRRKIGHYLNINKVIIWNQNSKFDKN